MAPDVLEPLHNLLRNEVSWEWTDECEKAFLTMGAVLSQLHNGIEKSVDFKSATLNYAQKNYRQLHREALITYHELLSYLVSEKKIMPQVANARLLRCSIILSSYQYKIQYKKGKNNQKAECLSCLPNNCLVALPDDYDCNFIY
ncbi:hypothetical protein PR048_033615 [Dryococelus australis]|uniref:Uncharacterized protein n=1 Tax=Dryococelus australis TaxID=614101 RepID=A0ABQ9G0T2_9NEOP|nr:hypothetical protein PR048_033615 [Dryococelus australis]